MTRKAMLLASSLALLAPSIAFAADAAGEKAEASAPAKVERFGAPLPGGEALPLAEILRNPDGFAGKEVQVEGLVRAACTKKGCWMELAAPDGKGQGCRVTFKDYGFFVPKDAAGATARLAGVVQVKHLSKEQVDHYLSEGASFEVREDGTASEIRIVATGVELRR